jgi:hypothetical protein
MLCSVIVFCYFFFSPTLLVIRNRNANGKSVWPIAEQDYLIRWLFRSLFFFFFFFFSFFCFFSITIMSIVRIHTSSLSSEPIFLLLLLLSEHIPFMVFFFLRFTNRTMQDREKRPCYWIIEQETTRKEMRTDDREKKTMKKDVERTRPVSSILFNVCVGICRSWILKWQKQDRWWSDLFR